MSTISVRWLNGEIVSYAPCKSIRQLQFSICNSVECFVHDVILLDPDSGTLLNADDPCPEFVSVVVKRDENNQKEWVDLCEAHKEDRTAFLRACSHIPADADISAYFSQKCLCEDTIAIRGLLERFPLVASIDFRKQLKIAIRSMRYETMQALLDSTVVMDALSSDDKNRLFLQTATQNAPRGAECLLSHNADPNAVAKGTILHHICSQISPSQAQEYVPLFRTLLSPAYALEVNTRNSNGDSALLLAVANFLSPIALYLVDACANVNLANHRGLTPLHMAVLVGNDALVRALAKQKANVNAQDDRGVSVLDVAVDRAEKAIHQQLVCLGANVRQKKWPWSGSQRKLFLG